MQSRDLRQLLDATAAELRGQQAREKPPHSFVGRSQQTIDGTVFACTSTSRFSPTHRTFTAVDWSNMLSNHGTDLLRRVAEAASSFYSKC
jgi:hypothetical protein